MLRLELVVPVVRFGRMGMIPNQWLETHMPVTHDEISALAFKFWKERGEPLGSPEVDWERAEATLQLKAVNLVQTALNADSAPDFSEQHHENVGNLETYADRPIEGERIAERSTGGLGTDSAVAPAAVSKSARSSKRKPAARQPAP